MKIKDLITLNETNLFREYLENQGISNLEDSEIEAAYGVCEGHGYELFVPNLNSDLLYQVDYSLLDDENTELNSDVEDDFQEHNIESFIDRMLEYLGELCCDTYNNRFDYSENEQNSWKNYFETYNLLLDFRTKVRESFNKYKYTACLTIFHSGINEFKRIQESFDSLIDCEHEVHKLVEKFVNLKKDSNLKDLNNRYDFKVDGEIDRFLLEIKEYSKIDLSWDNCYFNITIKSEIVPKIYFVKFSKRTFGLEEHNDEIYHFTSKQKALKKFNELLEPYKSNYPECNLKEHDYVNEFNSEDSAYYELFIDDHFEIECSLDLAEIN